MAKNTNNYLYLEMNNTPKLTIELVPKTSWFNNVRSEVTKKEWDKLRKECYQNADHHCEICGGQGKQYPVACHEIWEYDKENSVQTLTGLIALCPACHEVKHIGLAQVRGNLERALNHLAEINEWTLQEAHDYAVEAFEEWQGRNQINWTVDISWLENKLEHKLT